jgi:hypothetical protein
MNQPVVTLVVGTRVACPLHAVKHQPCKEHHHEPTYIHPSCWYTCCMLRSNNHVFFSFLFIFFIYFCQATGTQRVHNHNASDHTRGGKLWHVVWPTQLHAAEVRAVQNDEKHDPDLLCEHVDPCEGEGDPALRSVDVFRCSFCPLHAPNLHPHEASPLSYHI